MSPFDHIPAVIGGILCGAIFAYCAFAAAAEYITRKIK